MSQPHNTPPDPSTTPAAAGRDDRIRALQAEKEDLTAALRESALRDEVNHLRNALRQTQPPPLGASPLVPYDPLGALIPQALARRADPWTTPLDSPHLAALLNAHAYPYDPSALRPHPPAAPTLNHSPTHEAYTRDGRRDPHVPYGAPRATQPFQLPLAPRGHPTPTPADVPYALPPRPADLPRFTSPYLTREQRGPPSSLTPTPLSRTPPHGAPPVPDALPADPLLAIRHTPDASPLPRAQSLGLPPKNAAGDVLAIAYGTLPPDYRNRFPLDVFRLHMAQIDTPRVAERTGSVPATILGNILGFSTLYNEDAAGCGVVVGRVEHLTTLAANTSNAPVRGTAILNTAGVSTWKLATSVAEARVDLVDWTRVGLDAMPSPAPPHMYDAVKRLAKAPAKSILGAATEAGMTLHDALLTFPHLDNPTRKESAMAKSRRRKRARADRTAPIPAPHATGDLALALLNDPPPPTPPLPTHMQPSTAGPPPDMAAAAVRARVSDLAHEAQALNTQIMTRTRSTRRRS